DGSAGSEAVASDGSTTGVVAWPLTPSERGIDGRGRGSGTVSPPAALVVVSSAATLSEMRLINLRSGTIAVLSGRGGCFSAAVLRSGRDSDGGTMVDVAVIGLGAMGSAAVYHLASRRLRVVGIEQFAPGHERGSSHGTNRIIRLGYFEHPSYVPLVQAAIPLWRALEHQSGSALLEVTGILEIGAPDSVLV